MSSGGSGKRGGGGSSSSSKIPSKMRETVQNLKEIVDCWEQEIYAMLRECNMDPNEAVHRLLTQVSMAFRGLSQQGSSMLQQGPQPTYMGMTGYPNLYDTQVGGISREHQQLPSHGNLNGSQGQSSRQPRHLWQHSY